MEIVWTHSAKEDLRSVFEFYKRTISHSVAIKVKDAIFSKVKDLQLGSKIGQLKESLLELNRGHRYIICQHCKIIYIPEKETVYITHVFDTRQNPSKLK